MLNSSTSTSITAFDIDVFTDFSLLFSPFFVSNILFFVATAYRFSKVFRKKSSSVGTAFVWHYPWSVILSSVETATTTETLQRVELHPGTTASHREIKKLLSEQQLVSAWNTIFFSLSLSMLGWHRCSAGIDARGQEARAVLCHNLLNPM